MSTDPAQTMVSASPRRRFVGAVTMFVVSCLSLLLLVYVGYGESQRVYHQYQAERLLAQGRIVQNAMENFLRPGASIRQYVGFSTLASAVIKADDAIDAIVAFDNANRPVFASGESAATILLPPSPQGRDPEQQFELRQSERFTQIILPLRNRFETVGGLAITMPRSFVTDRVERKFRALLGITIGLSFVFSLFVSIAGTRLSTSRIPWRPIAYSGSFLAMAAIVISTMINLYAEGAQEKAKALADSLGQRLSDIVSYRLDIHEIDGLGRVFEDYRQANADISAAGLIIDDRVEVHTDPASVGKPWANNSRNYEYFHDLSAEDAPTHIRVAVALPVESVYWQVARSVKNFAALFIASAFLAGFFLQVAGSMSQVLPGAIAGSHRDAEDEAALDLVKPVFFVAVFLEHMTYSFLPQFMHHAAAESGLSAGFASVPFMTYYLFFALSLVPAGHFGQRYGTRPIMYLGLVLSAFGVLALMAEPNFYMAAVARALSGVGQGMLFIGVQSYILATASPRKRTQAAAIIVFGYQGGMISGTAIGALLVVYMGANGVFAVCALAAALMALYAMVLVPNAAHRPDSGRGLEVVLRRLGNDIRQIRRSADFLKTMILIGIPAKAVLTGIIIFALPLLLAQKHYAQEDIGQIIMLYAAGVLLASSWVSRLVDRTGKTATILFWGSTISGVGLLLIGLTEWTGLGNIVVTTVVLIAGVIVVGLAHGLINAPVITHVADLDLSSKIGVDSATATYRFLERIGHAAGPIIVGQLFLFGGQTATVIAAIGGVIVLAGIMFLIHFSAPPLRPVPGAAP